MNTSKMTYAEIMADGTLTHLQRRVYDTLVRYGGANGLTGTEVAQILNPECRDSYVPRMKPLIRMGAVVIMNKKRCSKTRRPVTVWNATSNVPPDFIPFKEKERREIWMLSDDPKPYSTEAEALAAAGSREVEIIRFLEATKGTRWLGRQRKRKRDDTPIENSELMRDHYLKLIL